MTVALYIREGGVSKTPRIAVLEGSSSYFIACITVRSIAVLGLRPPARQAGDQDEQIEQSVRLQENIVLPLSSES